MCFKQSPSILWRGRGGDEGLTRRPHCPIGIFIGWCDFSLSGSNQWFKCVTDAGDKGEIRRPINVISCRQANDARAWSMWQCHILWTDHMFQNRWNKINIAVCEFFTHKNMQFWNSGTQFGNTTTDIFFQKFKNNLNICYAPNLIKGSFSLWHFDKFI